MDYRQKKNATTTEFTFEADKLRYSVEDSSGRNGFSVPYEEFPNEAGELVEKNPWYRNVAVLWMLLGAVAMAFNYVESGEVGGVFWLVLGLITYGIYRYKKTEYSVFNTAYGRVFVIKDKDHDAIVDEIRSRKRSILRERFGTIDFNNPPEVELRKFQLLKEEGAISEEEYEKVCQQIKLGMGTERTSNGGIHLN